jgi:hypothetical protein
MVITGNSRFKAAAADTAALRTAAAVHKYGMRGQPTLLTDLLSTSY